MYDINPTEFLSDLISPEEAAQIMSQRAGYKISPDDIKQLRRNGKLKAAKQFARTTLYTRAEIELAPLPKKHHPEKLESTSDGSNTHAEKQAIPSSTYLESKSIGVTPAKKTWRTLLSEIISDPIKRQYIASTLGIHPITLLRWVRGRSNPRLDTLRALPQALPQYREQLTSLIEKEYPSSFSIPSSKTHLHLREIPSTLYAFVHEANTNSLPLLRRYSVSHILFRHILHQLDPFDMGMSIFITQCVPPIAGRQVRSLRKAEGLGTGPWNNHEHYTQFFGNESQIGYTTLTTRPITLQNSEQIARIFPAHYTEQEQSIAVYPILLSGRIAGTLCITSTQPNYFSQRTLKVIQDYVNLFAIAFEPHDFYNINDIELYAMPPYYIQQPILATFQQKIKQRMVDALKEHYPLTRPQAELQIWQELEETLLNYMYIHPKTINSYHRT